MSALNLWIKNRPHHRPRHSRNIARLVLVAAVFLVAVSVGSAQTVRQAQFAGSWYPEKPRQLRETLEKLTQESLATHFSPPVNRPLKALILPHAGYVYSGLTASHLGQTLQGPRAEKVILMGPDHRVGLQRAAISDVAAYITPLGKVALDENAAELRKGSELFSASPKSDRLEHSLELVLPVLQFHLPEFTLVPIVMGHGRPAVLAQSLRSIINDRTLVVVSSDLSHFLNDKAARIRDRDTINAILELDPEYFTGNQNRACGQMPIGTLIHLARHYGWRPTLVHYSNSGDTGGDRSRVVGYAAIAFYGR